MAEYFNGIKLQQLRKRHGWSLQKLADITGSSKSYMWELENSKEANPGGHKLCIIAAALNTPAPYFYDMCEITKSDLEVLATNIMHLTGDLVSKRIGTELLTKAECVQYTKRGDNDQSN